MSDSILNCSRTIGIVIPVHNEGSLLARCLRAVIDAVDRVEAQSQIAVVLDGCSDDSKDVVDRYIDSYGDRICAVHVSRRNVGVARAAGFESLRERFGVGPDWWYATTDADSVVDANWLTRQFIHRTDMYLGLVRVLDWEGRSANLVDRYEHAYRARIKHEHEHEHVHGANMGFNALSYWRVGGFRGLATGEDVDLVNRFDKAHLRVLRDSAFTVATSSRTQARAPLGFSHFLEEMESNEEWCA